MKLSIVIPAHNEEERIVKSLEDYGKFFSKKYKKDFEFVIVLNACTDNTLGTIKRYQKKFSQIRYLNLKPGGKGFAIVEGFKVAKGDLIGFTDADDSTSAKEFDKLIQEIDHYDVVIGSRYLKESVVEPRQPFTRRVASRVFNFLVRSMFFMSFRDTQCGAKVVRKVALKNILSDLGLTNWAFDIDLLYKLKKKGFKIKEVAIIWKDDEESKLKVGKTSVEMLFSIAQLRLLNSPFSRALRLVKPPVRKLYYMLKK